MLEHQARVVRACYLSTPLFSLLPSISPFPLPFSLFLHLSFPSPFLSLPLSLFLHLSPLSPSLSPFLSPSLQKALTSDCTLCNFTLTRAADVCTCHAGVKTRARTCERVRA